MLGEDSQLSALGTEIVAGSSGEEQPVVKKAA